ncbi:hypothetical protein GLX27_004559 [Malassezia furfur]|uniref:Kelch repeat-containing protein n=1 Tax=Malassezia furfur TaxID=55194 RepID=A0ABY8EW91_MALFU|nr:hypothetical protein GLX27_004559 [Malassezia furfur]
MITPKFLSLATFIAVALHLSHGAAAMSEAPEIQNNPLAMLGSAALGHSGTDPITAMLGSLESHKTTPEKAAQAPADSLQSMLQVIPGGAGVSVSPETAALYHTTEPEPRWGATSAFLPSVNAIVFSGGQTQTHSTLTNDTLLLDMSGLQNLERALAASNSTPWLKVQASNTSEELPALAYAGGAVTTSSCPSGTVDTFWMVGGKTEWCKTDLAPMYTYNVEVRNATYYGTWRAMPGHGSGARRTHAAAVMPPHGLGNDRTKSMLVLGGDNWDEVCHNATKPQDTRSPSMDVWTLPEPFGETCRGTLPHGSPMLLHNATAHPLQLRQRLRSLPLADYAAVQLPTQQVGNASELYEPVAFFGGRDHNNQLVSFQKPWVLDQATGQWDRWITGGDVPTPRVGHSATRLSDGTVLIYGGYKYTHDKRVSETPTDEMYALNPYVSPAKWMRVHYADAPANGPAPSARAYHSAAVVEDILVVAFGQQFRSTAYGLEKRGGTNVNASEPLVMFLETRPTAMQWRWTDKLSAIVSGRVTASFLGQDLDYGAGSDANGSATSPGQGAYGTALSAGAASLADSRASSAQGAQGTKAASGSGASGSGSGSGSGASGSGSGSGSSGSGSGSGSGSSGSGSGSGSSGSGSGSSGSASSGSGSGSAAGSGASGSGSSGSGSGASGSGSSASGSAAHSHGLVHGHGKGHKSAANAHVSNAGTGAANGAAPLAEASSYPDMVSVTGHPEAPTGFVSAGQKANSAQPTGSAGAAGSQGAGSQGANGASQGSQGSQGAGSQGAHGASQGSQGSQGANGASQGSQGGQGGQGSGSASKHGNKGAHSTGNAGGSGPPSRSDADGGWSPATSSVPPVSDPTTAAPSPTGAAGSASASSAAPASSSSDASASSSSSSDAAASSTPDHHANDNKSNGESTTRTGAIAGGVIGAAALAVGAVFGGLYAYRKRRESQQMAMLRSNGVTPYDGHDPESGGAPPVSSLWLQQPMKEMYAPSGGNAQGAYHAGTQYAAAAPASAPYTAAHNYTGAPLAAAPAGGRAMHDATRNPVRGPRGDVPASLAAGMGGGAAAGLGAAAAGGYAAQELYAQRSAATHGSRSDSTGSHHSYPYLSGRGRLHPDDGSNLGLDDEAATASSSSVDTHTDAVSDSVDGKTMVHGEEGTGMRTARSFRFPETRAHSPKPMSFPYPHRTQPSSQLHVTN